MQSNFNDPKRVRSNNLAVETGNKSEMKKREFAHRAENYLL